MLLIRDLYAGYGKSEVLQGMSFDVSEGKIITLIGANGAGKTTTLKTICGQVQATNGMVQFDGENITKLKPDQIVNRGITMIPEGRQLFPFLSVRDNLIMGSYRKQARNNAAERLEHVLEVFPRVREKLNQLAGSLSGGEQQMVAIARGMMSAPRILMFDEPSLGLSPLLVEQMFDVVRTVAEEGITVLLVEQNVYHTLKLADYGYVIENGQIALSGTGVELLDNPHIRKAYLGH